MATKCRQSSYLYRCNSLQLRVLHRRKRGFTEGNFSLGAGDFLGEMSFFDSEPRSARAVAHEDVKLLEIGNEDFKNHLERRSDVALKFLWGFSRTLSKRVRETNAKFSSLFAISRVF